MHRKDCASNSKMCCPEKQHLQKFLFAGCFVILLSIVYLYSKSWSIPNRKHLQSLPLNLLPDSHSCRSLHLAAPENASMRHVYITVRSVFLDTRLRNIGHENASVFLIEVRKDIIQNSLIIGCGVGKHTTTDFKVRRPAQIRPIKMFTHDFLFIDCFDLPVENGSTAFIIYKPSKNSVAVSTESEHPLHIPAPHVPPRSGQNFTVATCVAVLFGPHPHFINEWLHYQRTIGIDHIHVIAEDSFEKAGGFKNPYLKQRMDEGFVSVEVWTRWLETNQIFYHSQVLAYEDCIYRFSGTYDYLVMVDTDDFFVPRVPGEPKIHYYINNWCQNSGTCLLTWVGYYPDCGLGKVDEDGNVTAKLSSFVFSVSKAKTKALHTPVTVVDVGIHDVRQSLNGTKLGTMPITKAYIAHIRTGRMPPGVASHC